MKKLDCANCKYKKKFEKDLGDIKFDNPDDELHFQISKREAETDSGKFFRDQILFILIMIPIILCNFFIEYVILYVLAISAILRFIISAINMILFFVIAFIVVFKFANK